MLNAGHWPNGPGQVVLDDASGNGGLQVGNTMTITGRPGGRSLTVVGFANSITDTADGWVVPGEIGALQAPGAPPSAQLLYRFASAGTDAQVRADLAEVTGALPPGTVTGSWPWLAAESQNTSNGAIMEPFVVAFALIGLAMAVLIVANVVSGAVVAGYYRIGVLKSIGLTPAQVVVAYLSRVGVPALAGCVAGVVAGNVLAIPVLHQSAAAYGVGSQQVPWWASVLAPAGLLALTVLAALGPALRAGRLSATAAIAAGRAPNAGRGYAAHRLAARLRLPRPVGMGLAAPFARPARTVSLAAIAFGATAVIFAFGLHASLGRAAAAQTLSATVPVEIQPNGPGTGAGPGQWPDAAQDAAVTAALRAQPGTAHQTHGVPERGQGAGLARERQRLGVRRRLLVAGVRRHRRALVRRTRPGGRQHRVPGRQRPVRRRHRHRGHRNRPGHRAHRRRGVPPEHHPTVFGSTQTLPGLGTQANLRSGTWRCGPARARRVRPGGERRPGRQQPVEATTQQQGGEFYSIATGLVGLLALMVAVAAGLGVLNTVLMTTRDRVHDLGIFKALGMRPGQMLTMVVCWIVGPAVLAGAIAAPPRWR